MIKPTPYLHGNSESCPACDLRRAQVDTSRIDRPEIDCQLCDGRGFLPLAAAEIVRRTVAEIRRLGYWRDFDARNGIGEIEKTPRRA